MKRMEFFHWIIFWWVFAIQRYQLFNNIIFQNHFLQGNFSKHDLLGHENFGFITDREQLIWRKNGYYLEQVQIDDTLSK